MLILKVAIRLLIVLCSAALIDILDKRNVRRACFVFFDADIRVEPSQHLLKFSLFARLFVWFYPLFLCYFLLSCRLYIILLRCYLGNKRLLFLIKFTQIEFLLFFSSRSRRLKQFILFRLWVRNLIGWFYPQKSILHIIIKNRIDDRLFLAIRIKRSQLKFMVFFGSKRLLSRLLTLCRGFQRLKKLLLPKGAAVNSATFLWSCVGFISYEGRWGGNLGFGARANRCLGRRFSSRCIKRFDGGGVC